MYTQDNDSTPPPLGKDATRPEAQVVPVNVYETDTHLVVVAALPGVMSDDVTLAVRPGALTVDAGLRSAAPTRRYLMQEWTYGPYHREVAIPPGWGADVEASLGNGQLAVSLAAGDPPEDGITHAL